MAVIGVHLACLTPRTDPVLSALTSKADIALSFSPVQSGAWEVYLERPIGRSRKYTYPYLSTLQGLPEETEHRILSRVGEGVDGDF